MQYKRRITSCQATFPLYCSKLRFSYKKNCRYVRQFFFAGLNNYSLLLRMISSASFASAFVSCGVSFKI